MAKTFDMIVSSQDGMSVAEPSPGELTAGQGRVAVAGSFGTVGGFRAPPAGTFRTYRKMRGNPTIAMARMAAFAPVKAAAWSVEADEGVPDEIREFVEEQVMPLRSGFMKHAAYSLDYGFAAWEKVWAEAGGKWVLDKLKPLLPDKTKILVDPVNGGFAGLDNADVMLDTTKSLVFTHDQEAGDFYGRPRSENVRKVWSAWEDALDRIGAQVNKVSGTTPMVRYPEGRSKDASGTEIDNYDLAVQVLENLTRAKGIAIPDQIARWGMDLVERGVDPTKLKSWMIEFMDTSSGHIAEGVTLLQHLEKLIVRGYLVPERSVTEATLAGSRADSESGLDLAMMIAEDTANDLDECFNQYVINPIVELNYGPEHIDHVRIKHQPLTDEGKALMKGVIGEVLKNPANVDLLTKLVDLDAELDKQGITRVGDIDEVMQEKETKEEAQAKAEMDAQLAAMQQGAMNGPDNPATRQAAGQ